MDVLFVGSGLSALKVKSIDTSQFVTCAVNNAWRIFEGKRLDYWARPGDFPPENCPVEMGATKVIGYEEYHGIGAEVCAKLGKIVEDPQFHIGYTMFFQGLYWLIQRLKPENIYLLGFDFDYDKGKVERWVSGGQPSPFNNYADAMPDNVGQWVDRFFQGYNPDSFYGHGTPDPFRLGQAKIVELFSRVKEYAPALGVNVYNGSGVTHGLNTLPQCQLPMGQRNHYNFIEIGTCDFDTLIATQKADAVGISVEPVAQYLDVLPSPPNVIKLNEAVSSVIGSCEVRYVPRERLAPYSLPEWLAGCTQINSTHPIIGQYIAAKQLPSEEVKSATVPMTTLMEIYRRFNVWSVDYLKIDTEGHDTVILDAFIQEFTHEGWLKKRLPKRILFESNSLTPPEVLETTLKLYRRAGYTVESTGYNTILVR